MNNSPIRAILSLSFCWLLLLIAGRTNAQQTDLVISGKVTRADNNRPVRQASVSIARKGVGTATNTAGKFVLIIPTANLHDTLKISCIGYKPQLIAISTLKQGTDMNLQLEKNSTELQEVTITYYDANKIIQKAITRIGDNYINHPHILRGFYRMYTYADQDPLQLSEAVFDVYNFGYADTRADLFRLIKARNEKNDRDFASLEFGQRPNSIFEEDIVNHLHACGFLNSQGLNNHQFEVTGITDVNGYKAYVIEFKEKPGADGATFRGKMSVDTKTDACIYFDFGLSPTALENGVASFAQRSLVRTGNVRIDPMFNHAEVKYQEVGNKWVLASVEGDDSLAVKNPDTDSGYVAHVKFNYQITAVDTSEKESFNSKIGRNDNINAYKSNGDEKFWKDYNILLSDYDAEDVFKKLKAIDKVGKVKTGP